MKTPSLLLMTFFATTFANVSNAQQPPDSVSSDSCFNTAMGSFALANNQIGTNCNESTANTAAGYSAMIDNVKGTENTAVGYQALSGNFDGVDNTAVGHWALRGNVSGIFNTAFGDRALVSNSDGSSNTGSGVQTLAANTTGNGNAAFGLFALQANTTGSYNVADGYQALLTNNIGSHNIAIGDNAGEVISGSNNVDIANIGNTADNGAIRIGTKGTQNSVFIAGVATSKVTGSAVYVTSGGRLGVLASSERYKTKIAPMGDQTDRLAQLRPVTFHLKFESEGALQYGLIAEEVAKVYPELVIRGSDGKVEGVRYDELAPMLVNEMQKQRQKMTAQEADIRSLKEQLAMQTAQVTSTQEQLVELQDLKKELQAAMVELHRKDSLIARR
jgi:hypothetical protein